MRFPCLFVIYSSIFYFFSLLEKHYSSSIGTLSLSINSINVSWKEKNNSFLNIFAQNVAESEEKNRQVHKYGIRQQAYN